MSGTEQQERMFAAIGADDIETVQELILGGVNVNFIDTSIDLEVYIKDDEISEEEQRDTDRAMTFLQKAMCCGNLAIVELLLAAGADADLTNELLHLPVALAIQQRRNDILLALIKAGADLNAMSATLSRPLHFAIAMKDAAAVEMLLRYGADLHAYNFANSFLGKALVDVHGGALSVANTLIMSGATLTKEQFELWQVEAKTGYCWPDFVLDTFTNKYSDEPDTFVHKDAFPPQFEIRREVLGVFKQAWKIHHGSRAMAGAGEEPSRAARLASVIAHRRICRTRPLGPNNPKAKEDAVQLSADAIARFL